MVSQTLTINHFYRSKAACALYVSVLHHEWDEAPSTCVLTTTIQHGKSGGSYVTFVIEWLSDDTETQTFLERVRNTLSHLLPGGLCREYDEREGVVGYTENELRDALRNAGVPE